MSKILIPITQVEIGHYVSVPNGYLEHPFLLNSFKIKDDMQIVILKKMGLTEIEINTHKSTLRQLESAEKNNSNKDLIPDTQIKRTKKVTPPSFNDICRTALKKADNRYKKQVGIIQECFSYALLEPDRCTSMIEILIGELQIELKQRSKSDIRLCTIISETNSERMYQNALNTLILTLIIGNELNYDSNTLNQAAQIAIFHNFGEIYVPESIRKNNENLSTSEHNFFNQHPIYGENKLKETEAFDETILQAIRSHHERLDGSGFPKKLKKEQLSPAVQLIGVVDGFEELINNRITQKRVSANQAVSFIFKQADIKFNKEMAQSLIKHIGIYPPGTTVKLDEHFGVVAFSNFKKVKHPIVKLYNAENKKYKVEFVDTSKLEDSKLIVINKEDIPDKEAKSLNIPNNCNFSLAQLT